MGLDTTHDCWHGPYSSFNRFREDLCRQININLNDLYGYGGKLMSEADIKHDIMPLINHSDCGDELTVEESKRIVKGLSSILDNLDGSKIRSDSFKLRIEEFIKGCGSAISKNEIVEFH